eukprot:jgi/Botrbrau1/23241/Bobra.0041s0077.1
MAVTQGKFEDIFEVLEVDPDGKKFDKVSRIHCRSDLYETDVLLDINSSIYPLTVGNKFTLKLTDSVQADGSITDPHYNSARKTGKTVLDQWDYVMYGKIFKRKEIAPQGLPLLELTFSFGGLLLRMRGDPKKLEDLEEGSNVYLLMRKV